ncbi:aspartate aminotransferase family protein [Elusimicrobiota bacterium]
MSGFKFCLIPKKVEKIRTKHREIKTKLPVPESLNIFKTLDKYESVSMHGQLPIVWDKAKGFQVFDKWGNKWIDFTSTIFVANAGHGNSRIVNALKKVISKPLLHTYTFANQERADYLKYLIKKTPPYFEKAFLLSAGTEAIEAALKLMRMHGQKTGKRKLGIIAFEGNWHGRTLGAQMMSHNALQKEWIGYLDPNIYHIPFPYPWRKEAMNNPKEYFRRNLEKLMKEKSLSPREDICGIMIETLQGWGAVPYPKEFINEVEIFAKDNGITLAFDEMQSGFGRTGKLFGYMHYGATPDLICCGKGVSSGLPLSIVLGRKEIMDLPEIGSMSSTHSANPLVCSAGRANLQAILEDGLIKNAENLGKIFHKKLNKIKARFPSIISDVLGQGLIAAIHFNTPDRKPLISLCDKITELCMQKGLLVVHTGRESIKLAPPLVITKDALEEGISALEETIEKASKE